MNKLFSTFAVGPAHLTNRIVMAPMTRCRATADHTPTPLMARYYAARAAAGLIVTEGTSPSPNGVGYARIPGLYTDEQERAWRVVTDAVHAAGGRIFVQLMHTGRVSHPLNMPAGSRILAPSPVPLAGTMWTDAEGLKPYPTPIKMTEADIEAAVDEFADGAARAIAAGFDGVELHGANGYLMDQFLNTASNRRADRWGGGIGNRMRFALDTARAAAARIGAERIGMRLSPYGVFNDQRPDPDMDALYTGLAGELGRIGLAYLHVLDHSSMGAPPVPARVKQAIRSAFKGPVILAGGYDAASAESALRAGEGDLVAFGKPFIANPDMVQRIRGGVPLAAPVAATFYTPGEVGYTDYPVAT